MQDTCPFTATPAVPDVPAPDIVMPTTPPVSDVLALTAVPAPVSFVRVLRTVPVLLALANDSANALVPTSRLPPNKPLSDRSEMSGWVRLGTPDVEIVSTH